MKTTFRIKLTNVTLIPQGYDALVEEFRRNPEMETFKINDVAALYAVSFGDVTRAWYESKKEKPRR